MRIISGKYAKRNLFTLKSQKTRPTSDKVKDSLTLSLVGRVFWLLRVNKFRLAYFPEIILT